MGSKFVVNTDILRLKQLITIRKEQHTISITQKKKLEYKEITKNS